MITKARFSPEEVLDIGLSAYLYELHLLVRVFNSDSFAKILPQFRDYENFLSSDLDKHFSRKLILETLTENQVIDAGLISDIDERLFIFANLAAAGEIFHGWTIDAGTITAENCQALLQENIQISGVSVQQLGQTMGVRLNCGDAVRMGQIIKLLGLLPIDSNQFDQLALGASMARRDRLGLHRIPGIGPDKPGGDFTISSRLNFAVKTCEPKSLVIIDNDKNLQADYEQINRTEGPRIQALNLDLYEGLDHLVAAIERGDCASRNLVTMFRLEPRALPDIPLFLNKLDRVVSKSAFFLATIGAGNTDREFIARQLAMDDLVTQLKARGLAPLRINMHGPSTQANAQVSPSFGASEFASYEILFCKLGPESGLLQQRQNSSANSTNLSSTLNPQLWNSFFPTNRMEMAQGVIDFLKTQGRLSGLPEEVLNLGSGVGETSSCLEKLHPAFLITDIDQVPYNSKLMNRRYLQSDVTSLPFQDNSYDALFSSYTFSYLSNTSEVMTEWLRVLKPGGAAYFIFHAPHSLILDTAREMLSADMAKDFLRLNQMFPGKDFNGLYNWFCQQNFAWRMAFTQEKEFLSYAHEIQVCKHLVEKVASLMFSTDEQIFRFFEQLGVRDISVNVLDRNFTVLANDNSEAKSMLGWFVALRKGFT